MPDDPTKRRPQDASRISLTEPYEVNWWTHKFGITRAELERAVRTAGHGAAAVARHLGKSL